MRACKHDDLCLFTSGAGIATPHPYVAVAKVGDVGTVGRRIVTGCYKVLVAGDGCKNETFGWRSSDFSNGLVLCQNPGKELQSVDPEALLLAFHPRLLSALPLQEVMDGYSFFRYSCDEALYVSVAERSICQNILAMVGKELANGVDDMTAAIVCNMIELLLNYVARYYKRQFTLRNDVSPEEMQGIAHTIDAYLASGQARNDGWPTAGYVAATTRHSVAYLCDLVKHCTGKTFANYVQLRSLQLAKEMLLGSQRPVADIAPFLGFCSVECFRAAFKTITGCTPEQYRL